MTAKDELLQRLEFMGAAIDLPAVIDVGIAKDVHNGVANLLRKGLAIVSFNILEDFIKKRSGEALDFLSGSGVEFALLTDAMQEAAILDTLSSLSFRAKLEKKNGGDGWRSLIQEEALKIRSTGQTTFKISSLSLASSGSNVQPADVVSIMSAFGIKGGWAKITAVIAMFGGGLPDAAQAYRNAFERRHSSAHSVGYQYSHAWLFSLKNEIIPLAVALDVLLAARCRQVKSNVTMRVEDHVIEDALKFRFLEQSGTLFRQTSSIGGASKKNWPDLQSALAAIRPTLEMRGEFLIVLDAGGRIKNWYVN